MSDLTVDLEAVFIGLTSKQQEILNGSKSQLNHQFHEDSPIQVALDYYHQLLQLNIQEIPEIELNEKKVNDVSKALKEFKQDKAKLVLKVTYKLNPSYEVYLPSKLAEVSKAGDNVEEEEGSFEFSTEDARKYQQILASKANAQSDYVKDKLRKEEQKKKDLRKPKNQAPQKVSIRVKFPDTSLTQLNFNSANTVDDMIQFLNSEVLVKSDFRYNLITPTFNYANRNLKSKQQPDLNIYYKDIESKAEILTKSLAVYNNLSFVFELLTKDNKNDRSYPGPFAHDENAKTIETLIYTPKPLTADNKLTKVAEKAATNAAPKKATPKWLRLGKK